MQKKSDFGRDLFLRAGDRGYFITPFSLTHIYPVNIHPVNDLHIFFILPLLLLIEQIPVPALSAKFFIAVRAVDCRFL